MSRSSRRVSGPEVVPRAQEGNELVSSALRVVQRMAARDEHVEVLRRTAWPLRVQYLLHHLLSEEDVQGRTHERGAAGETLLRQVADEHDVRTVRSGRVVNAVGVGRQHLPLHWHVCGSVCHVSRIVVPTIV